MVAKRENGFTLAEILGVIVIVGLLSVVVVPTVMNNVNSQKGNFTKQFIYKFTDKIIIRKDCIEWHLNYLSELKKLRKYDKTILSNLKNNNLENYIGNIYIEPKDIHKYKDIIDISLIKQKEPIWVKIFV